MARSSPLSLPSKVYDAFKFMVRIVLPALGTLYFTLSTIWNLPHGKDVLGTDTAVCLFLGLIMHISSSNYQGDGAIVVADDEEGGKKVSLELHDHAAVLADKQKLTFKVKGQ